jgi:hypothetical protein
MIPCGGNHSHASVAAFIRCHKGSPFSKMKYEKCPLVKNGGILVSERVLNLIGLNQLQKMMLAYIENCDQPCAASTEHFASVLNCSKQKAVNALDALASFGFFKLDEDSLKDGIYINDYAEAWKRL